MKFSKSIVFTFAMLLPCLAGSAAGPEQEVKLKPPKINGIWRTYGRGGVGHRRSVVTKIQIEDGKGQVTFRNIVESSGGGNWRVETYSVTGPYPAVVEGNILSYKKDGKTYEYTFRFEGKHLLMPTVLRADDRTWVFKSPQKGTVTLKCEHDPSKVPFGKASYARFGVEKLVYVYERGYYSAKTKTYLRSLRFMERTTDGPLREEIRLFWDESGFLKVQKPGSILDHFGQLWNAPVTQQTYDRLKTQGKKVDDRPKTGRRLR